MWKVRGTSQGLRELHMNTLAALLSRIEYLAAENRDLSRKVEIYREHYIARQNESESKPPRKRVIATRT
jgi:hypothetical protein